MEQKMKVVYIAHPVSGDVKGNIKLILDIVKELNMTREDIVPFVPYLADLFVLNDNDPVERERGLKNDIALLRTGMVDELWLYGPRISEGMKDEIRTAMELKIPVYGMDARITSNNTNL